MLNPTSYGGNVNQNRSTADSLPPARDMMTKVQR